MEYKKITDLAYTYIGLVTTMTKHYVENGVPLLFNSSIKSGNIDLSKPVYLDYEFANLNKNRMHKKDDVITVHTGDIGTSAIIPEELEGSLGFATIVTRINDKNILLPKFLCYFLNYGKGKEQLYKYARDARNNLNLADYNRLVVPVPNIIEQRKIVEIIDGFHSIINADKKQLELLDEAVKSRFIEMFEGKDYPVLKWNDVFNTTTGKLDSNAMVEGGQYPFFTCAKEVFAIDKYAFDQEALLLAGNNAAGKYDVKYYKGKFNAYQRTYVLDLKQNWSYQLFKYQLEDKLEWLREQSKGCNTRYITLKILAELEFIIPPIEMQNQFQLFVEQIDKSKFNVQQHLDLMQELLDKKMDEYFGGE